jgi:hypothetical protein
MATVTPNFNWPVPTSTDLVKDGATAIEALGDSIDASLVDLKGGTTGQVLSKTSGTDMDFTWVTSDDANAIQNTIVDAKGDLISASAADTPARLAVGANGETLVADSAATTGLRYQSAYNGNAIINGGMDIWQRGTSMTAGGTGYKSADRYYVNNNINPNYTFNQVASGFDSIRYAGRIQRASGSTNTTTCAIGYTLETNDSIRFQGKTVTFSFYAKKGSNYSGADLNGALYYGTGTDQQLYSFTGLAVVGSAFSVVPTTSWVRYSLTGTVSTSATEIGFQIQFTPTGTAGANDFIDITGIQLEEGSVATTFKRSGSGGGTIQGELAACQRYYYVAASGAGKAIGTGSYVTGSLVYVYVPFNVTMRTTPTLVSTTGTNYYTIYVNNGFDAMNSWTIQTANTTGAGISNGTEASSTQGFSGFAFTENASSSVAFSAEL